MKPMLITILSVLMMPALLTGCGSGESFDLSSERGVSEAYCHYLFECNECSFPDHGQAVSRCGDAMMEGIEQLPDDQRGQSLLDCGECVIDGMKDNCNIISGPSGCLSLCSQIQGETIMQAYMDHNGEDDWYVCIFCSSSHSSSADPSEDSGFNCKEDGSRIAECECDEGERSGETFEHEKVCTDEEIREAALDYCAGGEWPE